MKRQRSLTIAILLMMALVTVLWTVDAWARAGRGSTSGSRGTRSYSAPAPSPSPGTASPGRQTASPTSTPTAPPQRSGFFGGLMGGIGGLLLGGLIGSMLFGGMGGGGLGGFGLMELIILGVLAYLAFSFFRRRQQQQPAVVGVPGYETGSSYAPAPIPPALEARATAVEPMAGPSDLDRGVGHIRQTDLAFDPARLAQDASQTFFRIQSAWSARDLAPVRDLLTPEMVGVLQADLERLRSQGKANRIENMLMQGAEVTEAWQESGQDFATVRLAASLLDYTVEEASGRVVEGSRTEPVSFQEYWTFVRPVGANPWRLSAIQQAG